MKTLPKFLHDKIKERTPPDGNAFAVSIIDLALRDAQSVAPVSERLAASFDLVVASKFYQYIEPEQWIWCGHSNMDYYAFLNACPFCVLQNRFVHYIGHKPGSGQIGPAAAQAFREVLAAYFYLTGKDHCLVCEAKEPIDLAIIDERNKIVFVAEVKAAPLFTPPVSTKHTSLSMQTQTALPLNHSAGIERRLHEASLSMFIPDHSGPFEIPIEGAGAKHGNVFDQALAVSLNKNSDLFRRYFSIWRGMWEAYRNTTSDDPLFWFGGACGLPRNPGEGWPKQADGRPKGSVSDGKTSVGMDRTDDIKKATFQALKLGVENRGRDSQGWTLLIGLASNLHAARHYDDYLRPYENIIWGWEDLNRAPGLYNLFDGIISFTRSHVRNEWLSAIFDWDEE